MTYRNERFDQLHANGPIFTQMAFQGTVFYVVGYQEARQILGDHKRFVRDFRKTLSSEDRTPTEPATDTFANSNRPT